MPRNLIWLRFGESLADDSPTDIAVFVHTCFVFATCFSLKQGKSLKRKKESFLVKDYELLIGWSREVFFEKKGDKHFVAKNREGFFSKI